MIAASLLSALLLLLFSDKELDVVSDRGAGRVALDEKVSAGEADGKGEDGDEAGPAGWLRE